MQKNNIWVLLEVVTLACTGYKKITVYGKIIFLSGLNKPLLLIIRIIIKYGTHQTRFSIMRAIYAPKKPILKIINKPIKLMVKPDFRSNKLGGPGVIVQLVETENSCKCKSHRGKASTKRTDAFVSFILKVV
jgi:hypothetical protein